MKRDCDRYDPWSYECRREADKGRADARWRSLPDYERRDDPCYRHGFDEERRHQERMEEERAAEEIAERQAAERRAYEREQEEEYWAEQARCQQEQEQQPQ